MIIFRPFRGDSSNPEPPVTPTGRTPETAAADKEVKLVDTPDAGSPSTGLPITPEFVNCDPTFPLIYFSYVQS
jgi:hypothetical protein